MLISFTWTDNTTVGTSVNHRASVAKSAAFSSWDHHHANLYLVETGLLDRNRPMIIGGKNVRVRDRACPIIKVAGNIYP